MEHVSVLRVSRVLREYPELCQTTPHVQIFNGTILLTTDFSPAFHHSSRSLVTQQVSSTSTIVAGAYKIHGAPTDIVGLSRVELGQVVSQVLHDNVRVVVSFEKPIDGIAVFREAQPQCRHRLARQMVASFRHVESARSRDVARLARVEERRDVTPSRPRLAYGVRLPFPAARRRHYHAEDAWLTGWRLGRNCGWYPAWKQWNI